MGLTYGDAWLEWLYDLETEVRLTNPSAETSRVHRIRPKKYLVLPNTSRIFPDEILTVGESTDKSYYFEACAAGSQGSRSVRSLEDCEPGDLYRVSLVHRFFQVGPELRRRGLPVGDGVNEVKFDGESLESVIGTAKAEFMERLSRLEIPINPSEIYARLASVSLHF